MRLLGPTQHNRLNEVAGFVFLALGLALALSLVSYHPEDPSWNTATALAPPHNLTGYPGAYFADFVLQPLGPAAFTIPVLVLLLGWRWVQSRPIEAPLIRVVGALLLTGAICTGLSLAGEWRPFGGAISAGGLVGALLADYLIGSLNLTGAALLTGTCLVVSLYLISSFSMATVAGLFAGPAAAWERASERWRQRREENRRLKREAAQTALAEAKERSRRRRTERAPVPPAPAAEPEEAGPPIVEDCPPWETPPAKPVQVEEIPIKALEPPPGPESAAAPPAAVPALEPHPNRRRPDFQLPSTALLNEPPARNQYDGEELKDIAVRIKSKFAEFNVLGTVVQINPGPVVTTFEFKPEAGIKYSRIITLTEDLCLGLQAESILIERIPGKPTVGIEVPNSKREVISLRQMLESEEFSNSSSRLTLTLGKDISGRIKIASLETMPHLLIAGSTGSGKSVMLNSLIMSVLYKATPDEVRLILVDPKRVELGIYEGVPHLLTPVITDAKKATNALRNAVLEMERRLKLLAAHGVRNIEQFNRKVDRLRQEPRSLFELDELDDEELRPLPWILVLIDELADLMMVERANVEESVTRLAQMARAVGMHLVLATQRPSVDVITGLIKANFPARISFRVATRVDSRTILDVMGAEHLLGKGDMLFLPPGSSRLVRVHGAFVTEAEINRVVQFWKEQARPEYDDTFLIPPPSDEGEQPEEFEGEDDPMYEDAVRIVLEQGKASTSTLQRRLRLGYGRAARLLDMMQREGIIGPPDGSRPRDVLKRPDWLEQVDVR